MNTYNVCAGHAVKPSPYFQGSYRQGLHVQKASKAYRRARGLLRSGSLWAVVYFPDGGFVRIYAETN